MRWLTFILSATGVMVVQLTIAPRLELAGVRPDWLLVFIIFIALHAKIPDAIAAGWLIGLGADLLTIERFGLLSLSYGLTALLVVAVRDNLFSFSALTQTLVTFLAGCVIRTAWMLYQGVLYDAPGFLPADLGGGVLLAALYTAAWAPLVHRPFRYLRRWFGLPSGRQRSGWPRRTGRAYV